MIYETYINDLGLDHITFLVQHCYLAVAISEIDPDANFVIFSHGRQSEKITLACSPERQRARTIRRVTTFWLGPCIRTR